jgi:steroid delta-isomerase-like uncharacterized protein
MTGSKAMSNSQTTALITRYYDAFNAGDWAAMAALVSDDVAHDINEGTREIGREAFARFLVMMDLHYDEQAGDIVVMISQDGRRAAAELTIRGRYKVTAPGLPEAAGQRYSLAVGAFFDVDDGAISRVTTYYNLAEWMRQVAGN